MFVHAMIAKNIPDTGYSNLLKIIGNCKALRIDIHFQMDTIANTE